MQTIIFDVDDTLYDQLQPFHKAVHQHLSESFSDNDMTLLYKTSRKYSDEVFEQYMNGEITALELQTYRIMKACEEFGIHLPYEQAVLFQETYLAELQKIQLFEPMEQLLDKLFHHKKQLAILTNGESAHQRMKVAQLGLNKWIPDDHIFVSGEIGHSKPSSKVFEYIENKLKLRKQETIYIGDSFEHDITGAKHAGWQAIWLNHRLRKASNQSIKADYVLEHPNDILKTASSWYST
ncbi:HAD family hydrolase [Gracilibacillus caseinilyticus]|uniref:HAD family hydrolase n=1 Tax=Gracilibacillus caseinilyticus TaxID=2932256 RepID=A0ABY4F1J7_9BACI|nr:HAD family hydrolase [Gracilibacillus caseinilyticus]UOQ49937.1 HAD family hydrolase [Gracilibacillus caseinilyticus]